MKKPRQEWDPHWLIKLSYGALSLALSLVKIAVGAAATVLLIAGVGIRFIWAKCPHCGRYISRQHFNDKQCCYCGKNLLE